MQPQKSDPEMWSTWATGYLTSLGNTDNLIYSSFFVPSSSEFQAGDFFISFTLREPESVR